jgi:hypothetical protein
MFAEDGVGTLMATASQTCIVRFWNDPKAVAEQVIEQTAQRIEGIGGSVSETPPR